MLFSRTPKPASFAKIRMQILSRWLLKNDKKCSVIALTSRFLGEGVSTVTKGLARSFSSTGTYKILLLDVSCNYPRKTRLLDVTKPEDFSDLSTYVTKDKSVGFDTIKLANISHYNFDTGEASPVIESPIPDIPSDDDGSLIDRTSDSDLGAEQTRALFRILKKKYKIILIDAGTLNNSNATFWLLNSNVKILIIDSSRTTREALEHQKSEFDNSDIFIDGSILNKRKFPIPRFLYWLAR